MRMKIGASSTGFCSYSFEDVLDGMSKLFDHWEIVSEGNHHLPEIATTFESLKDSYDLTYSIHAPFSDVNIASLNESIRETSVIELIRTINIAAELNIKTVTFHPGLYSFVVKGFEEKSIANAKKSLRTIDRMAQECGVRMCLENMPSMPVALGHTVEEMNRLLEGTNLPVCIDLGHAFTCNQLDEMVEAFEGRVFNIHIHDNDGSMDQHLTIGEGKIDFESILPRLGSYSGRYIIESKSLESATDSRDRLMELSSRL